MSMDKPGGGLVAPEAGNSLKHDGPAGAVVFLVALPLCLGIALASGAPMFAGIIAGIVGGIVVGALSGSHVSVSGPAAGLTVIVLSTIQEVGSYKGFLVAVVISGVGVAGYNGTFTVNNGSTLSCDSGGGANASARSISACTQPFTAVCDDFPVGRTMMNESINASSIGPCKPGRLRKPVSVRGSPSAGVCFSAWPTSPRS
jgi:hypothetical protein